VYSYHQHPIVVIVYVAEVVGGDIKTGDESLKVSLFPTEKIPWERLAFPSTQEALSDYIKKYP
jgi:8-oxo-dGTP diphosphatase